MCRYASQRFLAPQEKHFQFGNFHAIPAFLKRLTGILLLAYRWPDRAGDSLRPLLSYLQKGDGASLT